MSTLQCESFVSENIFDKFVVGEFNMSIYNFFKKIDKPFSELVPSINTEKNILLEREIAEVSTSLENHEKSGKKRGAYKKFKPEDRREIGKSASIYGVSQTIKPLSERYPLLSK